MEDYGWDSKTGWNHKAGFSHFLPAAPALQLTDRLPRAVEDSVREKICQS